MRIFLTGAAGLIGGEVAARLLKAGHSVTALVHNNRDIRANDGSAVSPEEIVSGDVSMPMFGWDKAKFDRLTGGSDLLIHCAATVRFDLDDETYRRVNTGGAANAVEFARSADMPILHVSTAYVCGTRDGPILEADRVPDRDFTNGYEASKASAEKLVRASGVPFAIARPSIVVGDSRTGAIRQFDTIYTLFKMMAEGRIAHMPAKPGATLNFVPLDHVAGGIVGLAENMRRAEGGAYHLVSNKPLPVKALANSIAEFPHFQRPDLVDADSFDPEQLSGLERRLYTRVARQYAGYFLRDPQFDDRGAHEMTGLVCPKTDADFMRLLIQYCIDAGFLKGASETVA